MTSLIIFLSREVEEAERKVEEAMTKLAIAPVFEPEQVLHDAQVDNDYDDDNDDGDDDDEV